MKIVPSLAILAALVASGPGVPHVRAADEDGVAVAIIYDTSGSMKQAVRNAKGGTSPKYVIANRALASIARQIQAFATNSASGTPRKIYAGLFIFNGDSATEAVKFGPFNPGPFEEFAKSFSSPGGNTPLGNSLNVAARAVMNSPLSRKHVLIITDGENTTGPPPSAVMPRLKKQAEEKQSTLSVHFVAFDVAAKAFDSVKKQGATVVAANDEATLFTQLQFILQKKILLEDEEPAKK
jgi:uncharacterized glyoxalase superfamily protein PhnB